MFAGRETDLGESKEIDGFYDFPIFRLERV
jgi:hypothetical protein